MRWALVPLLLVSLLPSGCQEESSNASSRESSDQAAALANVRAAIPAIGAYGYENGTYAGMSLEILRTRYDQGVTGVVFVPPLNKRTYCVESTVGSASAFQRGPGGEVRTGTCAEPGPSLLPAPYDDPEAAVDAAIPAVEAYGSENGTYAGMTLQKLRRYDPEIRQVAIVRANKNGYCVESTINGQTYAYSGAAGPQAGGC
jgi:hypothetical protein